MLRRNGTVNRLSNIKDTFAESFQYKISVLHQSICIFQTGLLSISDEWVKHTEKLPNVSDSNQSDKAACNLKLRFTELKDFFIKRVQKNQSNMNYACSCLAFRIFSGRYNFKLWVFAGDMYFDKYYLRCYKVNNTETFKSFVFTFQNLCSQIICTYFAGCRF